MRGSRKSPRGKSHTEAYSIPEGQKNVTQLLWEIGAKVSQIYAHPIDVISIRYNKTKFDKLTHRELVDLNNWLDEEINGQTTANKDSEPDNERC